MGGRPTGIVGKGKRRRDGWRKGRVEEDVDGWEEEVRKAAHQLRASKTPHHGAVIFEALRQV